MSKSALNISLKYENTNLQEDLIFYKSQNFYFRTKIQDLEDEMRIVKEKLKKATATEEHIEEDYQLGPHFPEELLFPKERQIKILNVKEINPMNILILSRFEIENTRFDSSYIVISIVDNADNFPDIPEKNCEGILKIMVYDTEDGKNVKNINDLTPNEIPNDKIFNNIHAQEILQFVFKYLNEIDFIVCQSNLGWSRSAGAAAALSRILNGNDKEFFQLQHVVNKLIYKTILDEYEHFRIIESE